VGVGGGLVLASQLSADPQGHVGEIGHVVVHPDGPSCVCGGHSCLETLTGQDAIYSAAGIDQDSTAKQMARLLRHVSEGDELAVSAAEQAGHYLGSRYYAPALLPEGNVAFSGPGQTGALRGAAATSVRRILGSPYEMIS
jgi:ROK family protein